VFGLLTAWALVRYKVSRQGPAQRPGRPAVRPADRRGRHRLATLYAPTGWIGQFLTPLGIKVGYTPLGVVVALTFIGLPFVVRTLEPVLHELSAELEEAAASLGAGRLAILWRIILPALAPAWITGVTLAFARAIGEYGSVIFIAGNMPYKSEIAPLLIIIQLEQFEYASGRRHRRGAAGRLLRHAADHQRRPGLGAEGAGMIGSRRPMAAEDPPWIKAVVLTLVVGFLALVLMLPLAAVFIEACARASASPSTR